jgi:tetratricopeptide (TPR) repeat protein
MRRFLMVLIASAMVAAAQEAKQPSTVDPIDDLMDQASKLSGRGDAAGAVKILEQALAKAQKDPKLKGRDAQVMRGMGHVYATAKRYPDAVRVYKTLLEATKADCVAGNPLAEVCADNYYDLGTAQMYTEDWAGAAASLRKGISIYEVVVRGATLPSYKMAKLKLEANSQSMLAAAMFRAGDLPGAISTWQKAIQQYQTVVNNPDSGDGLRVLARQSMMQEQQSLKLVKEEQQRRAAAQPTTPKK